MSEQPTYRARFRLRVVKNLHIDGDSHELLVAGHPVVLSAHDKAKKIMDSDWLVMNARGFQSEHEARSFAARLKVAAEFASAAVRFGVDTGIDTPTSGFGRAVKELLLKEHDVIVRDNVHGIDVFEDDPRVRISSFAGNLTVRASPESFLTGLDQFFEATDRVTQKAREITLLLNYALMRTDPVAQIVFAFSAVEMLGQGQSWSEGQRALLASLAEQAKASPHISDAEREEVSAAISKGLHKLSLRQGVLRLLDELGLGHLRKPWDDLYGQRSTLVHGLAPKPGADYNSLAFEVTSLCGHILLTAITREVGISSSYAAKHYAIA